MSSIVCKKKVKKILGDFSGPSTVLEEKLQYLERPSTFEDVYNYMSFISGDICDLNDFYYFMNHEKFSKQEFEKQETLFRLFTYLGLIPEFEKYKIATFQSNVSENKLDFFEEYDEFYFQLLKREKMKDSGDSSDLTLYNLHKGEIILSTSKNYTEENLSLRKLDLEKIQIIYERLQSHELNDVYPIENLKICVVIPSKKVLKKKMETCRQDNVLNMKFIEILSNEDSTLLFDWNDLYQIFKNFKKMYIDRGANIFDKISTLGFIRKKVLQMKFHQELTYFKTRQLMNDMVKYIIWGHVCRSGKTFMIFDLIYRDAVLNNETEMMNYLILTTAPSETLQQYQDLFLQFTEFTDFQIIQLHEKKPWKLKKRNIFLCSIQRLRSQNDEKINKKEENTLLKMYQKLFKIPFDIMFVDEAHQGGITDLACKLYDKITSKHVIFVTATYAKPMERFKISREDCVIMDLYDYSLMKQLQSPESQNKICERFQIENHDFHHILSTYDMETIVKEYESIPKLHFLTWKPKQNTLNHILNEQNEGIEFAGLSIDSIFTLRQKIDGEMDFLFQ